MPKITNCLNCLKLRYPVDFDEPFAARVAYQEVNFCHIIAARCEQLTSKKNKLETQATQI
jgi:hypothetical protein